MIFFEFQEIYLDQCSKYRNIVGKTYLAKDKVASIAPLEVKDFPNKVYGVKLIDGLSYKGHSRYIDILIGEVNETK